MYRLMFMGKELWKVRAANLAAAKREFRAMGYILNNRFSVEIVL